MQLDVNFLLNDSRVQSVPHSPALSKSSTHYYLCSIISQFLSLISIPSPVHPCCSLKLGYNGSLIRFQHVFLPFIYVSQRRNDSSIFLSKQRSNSNFCVGSTPLLYLSIFHSCGKTRMHLFYWSSDHLTLQIDPKWKG